MKNKKNIGIYITIIIMLLSLIVISISLFKIYKNNQEYEDAQKDIEIIQDKYVAKNSGILIKEDTENNSDKNNDVNSDNKIIKNDVISLPSIDLKSLKQKNNDVIGWIYIPDTKINYPILQGPTNNTYLRANINKKYSIAGSIFLESKNNKYLYDANSIIFGHNMRNGDMFHDLRYFRQKNYINSHNKVYIYIEDYILEYTVSDSKIVNKKDNIYIPKTGNIEAQYLYEISDKTKTEERKSILKQIYNKNQLILSSCYSTHGDDRTIVISQLSNIYFL